MKLPNWLKISWWVVLTGLLTWFLYERSSALFAGQAVPADIVVFVIWVALLLAPLFNEVSLLGIKLKQEIDELKGQVASQISDVRNEIRNSVDARASVSQQFTIPMPAPDSQLPAIEAKIKQVISEALSSHGFSQERVLPLAAPDEVGFLFAARYNIERELRRIADSRQVLTNDVSPMRRRPMQVYQLVAALAESGRIDPQMAHAIREVYAVCSPAIHGEAVSDVQVGFVKDVAPGLVGALKAIQ